MWVAILACALALGGCAVQDDDGDDTRRAEVDFDAPAYVESGEEIWDGWKVPEGSLLLGSAFPAGAHLGEEQIVANALVVGDPHDVMRDVADQISARGLEPRGPAAGQACEELPSDRGAETALRCDVRAVDGDEYLMQAELTVESEAAGRASVSSLTMRFGATPRIENDAPAEAPEGDASMRPQPIDPTLLEPGAELRLFGEEEPFGEVPDGARLLAPSEEGESPTYSIRAFFDVSGDADSAIAELEEMTSGIADGHNHDESVEYLGDVEFSMVSYSEDAGGCAATLNVATRADDVRIAKLSVDCD